MCCWAYFCGTSPSSTWCYRENWKCNDIKWSHSSSLTVQSYQGPDLPVEMASKHQNLKLPVIWQFPLFFLQAQSCWMSSSFCPWPPRWSWCLLRVLLLSPADAAVMTWSQRRAAEPSLPSVCSAMCRRSAPTSTWPSSKVTVWTILGLMPNGSICWPL